MFPYFFVVFSVQTPVSGPEKMFKNPAKKLVKNLAGGRGERFFRVHGVTLPAKLYPAANGETKV